MSITWTGVYAETNFSSGSVLPVPSFLAGYANTVTVTGPGGGTYAATVRIHDANGNVVAAITVSSAAATSGPVKLPEGSDRYGYSLSIQSGTIPTDGVMIQIVGGLMDRFPAPPMSRSPTTGALVAGPIVRGVGNVIPKIPKLGLGRTKFGTVGYKRISGYCNGPSFGTTTHLSASNETWIIVIAADGEFDQVSVELPLSIAASGQAIWVISAKAIGSVSDLSGQVDTTGYVRLSNATAGADTIAGVNGPVFGAGISSPFLTQETSQVGRIRSIPRTDGGTKPLLAIMVQFASGVTYSTINYTSGSYAAAAEIWRTNPKNGDILLCNYSASWTGPKFVTTKSYDFPIIGVNFGYLKPTYNICRFGDSKSDGAGASVYKRDGFVRDQIEILRTQFPGIIICDMNFSCPSIAQLCFPACLNYLTNSTKLPDMLVLPISVVGADNEGTYATYHPILRKIIQMCEAKNITLVMYNSGPVNVASVNVQATDYQRVQNNLEYAPLIDIDVASISSGANNGGQIEFAPGMAADGIHESDLALALYGAEFLPYAAAAIQGAP